jgi:hypothetical protein
MPHKGEDVESHCMGFCDIGRYYFAVIYLLLDGIEKLRKIQGAILENSHIILVPFKSVNK